MSTTLSRPKRINPKKEPPNPEWVDRAFDPPFLEAELTVEQLEVDTTLRASKKEIEPTGRIFHPRTIVENGK